MGRCLFSTASLPPLRYTHGWLSLSLSGAFATCDAYKNSAVAPHRQLSSHTQPYLLMILAISRRLIRVPLHSLRDFVYNLQFLPHTSNEIFLSPLPPTQFLFIADLHHADLRQDPHGQDHHP